MLQPTLFCRNCEPDNAVFVALRHYVITCVDIDQVYYTFHFTLILFVNDGINFCRNSCAKRAAREMARALL